MIKFWPLLFRINFHIKTQWGEIDELNWLLEWMDGVLEKKIDFDFLITWRKYSKTWYKIRLILRGWIGFGFLLFNTIQIHTKT